MLVRPKAVCARLVAVALATQWICAMTSPSAEAATSSLVGTLRDFKRGDQLGGHPDFENLSFPITIDTGIVQSTLGVDQKPVYAGAPTSPSTTGATNFNQWYRDVSGVNSSRQFVFTLDDTGTPGVYTYGSDIDAFFPIDDQLFGNEELAHNFHFTIEAHAVFTHAADKSFTFFTDDDLFVFINGQRVVNNGGIHGSTGAAVDLDDLGLTIGQNYSFDLFFAERRTGASDFFIQTDLQFPTLPGDYNRNGIVDTADYSVWRDRLGSTFSLPNEGTTPNVVDQADYTLWKSNFGNTLSSGGGGGGLSVPEPTTLGLGLILAVIPVYCRARRS